MKPKVLSVIPARLGSKRFSGKVLFPYEGKPLLFYVWNEARKAKLVDQLVIATDNQEVADAAEAWGAEVVMSSKRHTTGSDRVAEVARRLGGEIIVNIQADNFGLKSRVIDKGVLLLQRSKRWQIMTPVTRLTSDDELFDPNTVKVAVSKDRDALWFSRYPLPFLQQAVSGERAAQFRFLKHIGVYFFKRKALLAYAAWPQSSLEKAESLEQLRILEHGERIGIFETTMQSVSVDSPHDVEKLSVLQL